MHFGLLWELISYQFLPALPKEYQKIGKALQSLAAVFSSSGYQGTAVAVYALLVRNRV